MHRHGYQGKKFGRERDQRLALIRGLARSLIMEESIVTTLPKAKEAKRFTEKIISKAGSKDLANRRRIMALLNSKTAANRLIDEIAPKLGKRSSGFLTVKAESGRRGDDAVMARLSFVDDLKSTAKESVKTESTKKKTVEPKAQAVKPAKEAAAPIAEGQRQSSAKPQSVAQAPKRTGFRGNR